MSNSTASNGSNMLCSSCNQVKEVATNKIGVQYRLCISCYQKEQRLFWAGKQFRVCKVCDEKLPRRMFKNDKNECPYAVCNTCFEARVAAAYKNSKFVFGAPGLVSDKA